MKKIIALLMSLTLVFGLAACSSGDKEKADGKVLKIGVIQLIKHDALDRAYEGFVAGLEELGYVEGENLEIEYQVAAGEQANCLSIAESMINDKKDLIFTIATPAAQAAASKTDEIPIVLTAVTDPAGSGIVASNEEPGRNVTGTSDLTPVAEQIDLLTQIIPDAKKVAVLYCSTESNSEIQLNMAKEAAKAKNLEIVEASVSSSNEIQQMVASLRGKVDAIYVPTDNVIAAGMETVSMVATDAGLPVICGEAGPVKAGGLATLALDYYDLGVSAAKQAVDILVNGKDITKMPIEYLSKDTLKYAVNKAIAKQLGITIPEEILKDAEVFE